VPLAERGVSLAELLDGFLHFACRYGGFQGARGVAQPGV
jgi:hypothetical protein